MNEPNSVWTMTSREMEARTSDDVKRKIIDILTEAGERISWRHFGLVHGSVCESPIEMLMLAGFMAEQIAVTEWPQPWVMPIPRKQETLEKAIEFSSKYLEHYGIDMVVWPQVEIGSLRTDFLCLGHDHEWKICTLAIECDGHDFHDRTREQVRRDKARDRLFVAQGVPTMRFAGSEIWRDPLACVNEIQVYFKDLFNGRAAA